MKSILLILIVVISFSGFSQKGKHIEIISQNKSLPLQKIIESMIGEGVILVSYTSNQPEITQAIGSFTDRKRALGIKKGLVLSTGSVEHIVGKNEMGGMTATNNGKLVFNNTNHYLSKSPLWAQGDADLEATIGSGRTYDACIVEMDIIPLGNSLAFGYVFASEEYDEFVGSKFNDAFAFYITGEGLDGNENIAKIPKTDIPVSINNVNDGNPQMPKYKPQNKRYYKRNNDKVYIEYDGFTKLFKVHVDVVPYTSYHLKMVVADVGDRALDSGVFIEHKSVKSYNEITDVYFETNSAKLSKVGTHVLNHLVETMEDHPDDKLYLSGHTDDVGPTDYNLNLSASRVQAVYQFLLDNGLNKEDILLSYYGEDNPADDNVREDGRGNNRRVEIMRIPDADPYLEEEQMEQAKIKSFFEFDQDELFQNTPNPANDQTKIPLYLAGSSGHLEITDIKGVHCQKIAINRNGYQRVSLRTKNLVPGLYVVSLIADGAMVRNVKMLVAH